MKKYKKILNEKKQKMRIILENDLNKAETILAVKDLNDQLLKISENVSDIMGKNVLMISDKISELWSVEKSEKFNKIVSQKLEEILNSIRESRSKINDFVNYLEGKNVSFDKEDDFVDIEEKDLEVFGYEKKENNVDNENEKEKNENKEKLVFPSKNTKKKEIETEFNIDSRKKRKTMRQNIKEVAPPSKKIENFIKDKKKDFKERYGKNWEKVLYATAWKKYNKKT